MDLPTEITPANPSRQNDNDLGPFLCKICSKAFTKRPQRNRHVLYCRKKLGDDVPILKKSCAACRKAKVKCSSEVSPCRRCTDKDLACVYELTRRSESLAQQPASALSKKASSGDTATIETSTVGSQSNISWDIPPSCHDQALLHSNIQHSRPSPTTRELSYQNITFEWEPDAGWVEELEDCDVDSNLYSNTSGSDYSLDWFSSGPLPSLTFGPTFSTPADCMFHTPYLVLRPMDYNLSYLSNSLISQQTPFIHACLSSGSQIGRAFLMQNMESYTTLLATSSTLPPFIHPVSLPTQGPSLPCYAPLEICKSVVSLYASKTAATSPFIWRTITMEKDRFMAELEDADEWTTVSMLQAITLYILLRIFDQDSFSVEFDRDLVRVMTMIAIKSEQRELVSHAEVEGWRPEWKDWLLVESKRRTVTLLFILHLVFDIKPSQRAKSHVGLSVLPLPAHKQLWQAADEETWTREYDSMLRAREGRGYLRYMDLMDVGRGRVPPGERMKDVKAWMTGCDAYGMLVLMAATTL